jgi:hypothetical protein
MGGFHQEGGCYVLKGGRSIIQQILAMYGRFGSCECPSVYPSMGVHFYAQLQAHKCEMFLYIRILNFCKGCIKILFQSVAMT